MKVAFVFIFTLVYGSCLYSAEDKYKKEKSSPESKGTTVKVLKNSVELLSDSAKFLADSASRVFEFIVQISPNETFVELDLIKNKETEEVSKDISFSTGVTLGKHDSDFMRVGVIQVLVTAAEGEDVSFEEAKISALKFLIDKYGLSVNYLTIGQTKLSDYNSEVVGKFSYINIAEVDYNDVLASSANKKVDVILGGTITLGAMDKPEAYEEINDYETSSFVSNLGGSIGVRINDVAKYGSVIFEGYTKNIDMKKYGRISKNGVQVVFKDAKNRFKLSAGVAEESTQNFEFEGSENKSEKEFYLRGKYYLK